MLCDKLLYSINDYCQLYTSPHLYVKTVKQPLLISNFVCYCTFTNTLVVSSSVIKLSGQNLSICVNETGYTTPPTPKSPAVPFQLYDSQHAWCTIAKHTHTKQESRYIGKMLALSKL